MLGGMPAITGVPETCKSIIKARIFQKKTIQHTIKTPQESQRPVNPTLRPGSFKKKKNTQHTIKTPHK
jgi:hypothetical protein